MRDEAAAFPGKPPPTVFLCPLDAPRSLTKILLFYPVALRLSAPPAALFNFLADIS